jgi:4-amino-4-deoxy-L-arabinose transferase-like glycosyltransferase
MIQRYFKDNERWLWPTVTAVLAALVLFPLLGSHGFWDPQELSIADQARRVSTEGGWGKLLTTQPPLTVWAIAASIKILGTSELTARLPLALLAFAGVMATYLLGTRLRSRRAGFLSALVLVGSPLFLMQARQLTSNIGSVTGQALAVLGLVGLVWPADGKHDPLRATGDAVLVVAGLVLGFFASGLILGVAVPLGGVALASIVYLRGSGGARRGPHMIAAAVGGSITLILVGIALVMVYRLVPVQGDQLEVTDGYAVGVSQGYKLLLGGAFRDGDPNAPVTFNLAINQLAFGMFPWIIFAPVALLRLAFGRRDGREGWAGLTILLWTLVAYVVATFWFRKSGTVHFPAMTGLALGVALFLDDLIAAKLDGAPERAPVAARGLPIAAVMVTLAGVQLARDCRLFPEELASVHLASKLTKLPAEGGVYLVVFLLGGAFALTAGGALFFGEDIVRRHARTLTRTSVWTTVGLGAFFALFLSYVFTPTLSGHYSYKNLFDAYSAHRLGTEPLGVHGITSSGPDFYAAGRHEKLGTVKDLVAFLRKPERVFAIAPVDKRCSIEELTRGDGFFIINDENTRYMLMTNQLAPGEVDRNPLRRFLVDAPPPSFKRAVTANWNDQIELLGVDMPEAVNKGQTFEVTLWLKILARPPAGYTILAHFDFGGVRFQGDHKPMAELCPTTIWQPGDIVAETFSVTAGPLTHPRGNHRVFIGFFTGSSGKLEERRREVSREGRQQPRPHRHPARPLILIAPRELRRYRTPPMLDTAGRYFRDNERWLWPTLAGVFAVLVLFPLLGSYGFWDPQELTVADQARKLSTEGGWGAVMDTQPPLTMWSIGASIKVLGTSELSARLPLAFLALAAVMATYLLGARLRSRRAGFLAAVVLLGSPLVLLQARQLTSNIGAITGQAVTMLGLVGLVWPVDGKHDRLRVAGDAALTLAGLLLGFFSSGLLVGVAVPLAGVAVGSIVHLRRGDRSAPRTPHVMTAAIAGALALGLTLLAIATVYRLVPAQPGDLQLLGEHKLGVSQGYKSLLGGTFRDAEPNVAVTFDYIINQVSFGMFPWVILAPLAVLRLAFPSSLSALAARNDRRDWGGVTLLVWTLAAYLVATFWYRKAGEIRFPAVAGIAVAVGVFLDDLLAAKSDGERERAPAYAQGLPVAGVLVGLAGLQLARDIKFFPEELASVHLAAKLAKFPGSAGLVFVIMLLGGAFAVAAGGALFFGDGIVRRHASAITRTGVWSTVGIGGFFALFLSLVFTPALSEHFSYKNLFDSYHDHRRAGEPLGVQGIESSGPDYYAHDGYEKLKTVKDLVAFLQAPQRVFAIAPADKLCSIHEVSRGEGYHVIDDRNSRYLLLSNKLAAGEKDQNPLSAAFRKQAPETFARDVKANFNDQIELLGIDMPAQVGHGDKFKMTLWFKVLARPTSNYKLFVHFDGYGVRFQGDHEPIGGRCGTTFWQPGDIIADTFEVEAGALAHPRGTYQAHLGFFTGGAGSYKNVVVKSESKDSNNRVPVGSLRVK